MTAGWSQIARAAPTANPGRARSAYTTPIARPRSATVGGSFITNADPRIGRVRHGPECRLDRSEEAPDVDHHRREGQIEVVGVADPVRRDRVDPRHELVEIAGQSGRRKKGRADDEAEKEPQGKDERMRTAGREASAPVQAAARMSPDQAGRVAQ